MSCLRMPGILVDGLPTLQCLLRYCDIECLSREIVKEYALRDPHFGRSISSKSNRRRARARVVTTVQAMRQIACNQDSLRGWVLAPSEEFAIEGSRPYIAQRMVMLMAETGGARAQGGSAQQGFSKGASSSGLQGFLRDYSKEPWENVLAVGVLWRGSWSCCDRYRALASTVWEMTRYGFDYDSIVFPQEESALVDTADKASRSLDELSVQETKELTAIQNSLLLPKGYKQEYFDRVCQLADEMNQQAQEEFWERLRCA